MSACTGQALDAQGTPHWVLVPASQGPAGLCMSSSLPPPPAAFPCGPWPGGPLMGPATGSTASPLSGPVAWSGLSEQWPSPAPALCSLASPLSAPAPHSLPPSAPGQPSPRGQRECVSVHSGGSAAPTTSCGCGKGQGAALLRTVGAQGPGAGTVGGKARLHLRSDATCAPSAVPALRSVWGVDRAVGHGE